jgi:hypothetical protein
VSPSWRSELEVRVGRDGIACLPPLERGARVTLVLSSHHARYALLPWSPHLAREGEWEALARVQFEENFGPAAVDWEVRVSTSPKGEARVACAIDRSLLAELRAAVRAAGAKLLSVQPGLMHAFNARRREFRRNAAWLVAPEEGRLTLALIAQGLWELVRIRNVGPGWRDELQSILRREEELARRETPVEQVFVS